MKLIIEDDEGRKTVVPLVREEITIGRQDGNTIRLTERNVSRRHARLVKENGNLLIEDLGSYNGVRVNGEKITEKTKIKEGDLVEIGDYDLGIQGKIEASATPPSASPKQATVPPGAVRAPAAAKPAAQPAPPPQQAQASAAPAATQESEPPAAPQAAMPQASAGGATAIIRVSDIMKAAPAVEARDLQRGEMPRLVGLTGPARGKEMYLQKTEVKFGRTDENDLYFDHQSVSRQHARFVLDGTQWKVIDNKSANGVRINGEDYAVSNIKPGDTIELGHLKFRFCAPGEKFSPPPETSGEHKPSGPRPTTAELIAGASQPGRMPTSPGVSAAKKKGPPIGLIAGVVGGVVVLGVVAFLVLGKKGGEAGTGEDAVKQADTLAKQHKYIAAMDMLEKAGEGTATPNKKKIAEEARGEESYNSLKEAADSGDGDKAKNLFEKCAGETTYWCGKAGELADPVKAAYAKKHLAIANAAKSSGDSAKCQSEAGLVVQFDSGNSEAQSLQSSCAPQEKEAANKPAPQPKKESSGGGDKEAKAAKLATDCTAKLGARDFNAAVKEGQAIVSMGATTPSSLAYAYRCLGYGYAYLNDRTSAVKWLEKYCPYTTNDRAQVEGFIGHPCK